MAFPYATTTSPSSIVHGQPMVVGVADSCSIMRRRLAKKYVDFAVDMWTICGHVDISVDYKEVVSESPGWTDKH